jgi:hypothetical protein
MFPGLQRNAEGDAVMNYISIILLAICVGGTAFLLCFLLALCKDKKGTIGCAEPGVERQGAKDANELKAVAREGRLGDQRFGSAGGNQARGNWGFQRH